MLICKGKDAGFGIFSVLLYNVRTLCSCMLEQHEVSYRKQGGRCALTSYCALWEEEVSQGAWPRRKNSSLEPQNLCSTWQKCCVCSKLVLKGNVLLYFVSSVKQPLFPSPLEFLLPSNISALAFTRLKAGKTFLHSSSYVFSCSALIAGSIAWFEHVTCKHFQDQNK